MDKQQQTHSRNQSQSDQLVRLSSSVTRGADLIPLVNSSSLTAVCCLRHRRVGIPVPRPFSGLGSIAAKLSGCGKRIAPIKAGGFLTSAPSP